MWNRNHKQLLGCCGHCPAQVPCGTEIRTHLIPNLHSAALTWQLTCLRRTASSRQVLDAVIQHTNIHDAFNKRLHVQRSFILHAAPALCRSPTGLLNKRNAEFTQVTDRLRCRRLSLRRTNVRKHNFCQLPSAFQTRLTSGSTGGAAASSRSCSERHDTGQTELFFPGFSCCVSLSPVSSSSSSPRPAFSHCRAETSSAAEEPLGATLGGDFASLCLSEADVKARYPLSATTPNLTISLYDNEQANTSSVIEINWSWCRIFWKNNLTLNMRQLLT